MRRNPRVILWLFLTFLLGSTVAPAADSGAEIPADLVLQRFLIKKGGERLLVPVRIEGKEHAFLVDTGFHGTVFHHTLPLGGLLSVDMFTSGKGETVYVKIYEPPDARVGDLPLNVVGGVRSLDLRGLREASGDDYEGILGMDFLGRYVVHLDFDRGQILLLKSVPEGAGDPLPMFWDPGDIPRVVGAVTGGEPVKFGIDTGMTGFVSGTLTGQEVKSLTASGKMNAVETVRYETASGTGDGSLHQGRFLALGGFGVESPVFLENPALNALGLYFWSRFAVTFDFPKRRVFLRKSENYGRADLWNRSGLHSTVKDGTRKIYAVDDDGPASAAGVRVGDVLLEIGGMKLGEATPFQVAERLWQGGRVDCLVRHGSATHRLTMSIPERNR